MYGVGMGTAAGLKGLNTGWQVWGGAAPPQNRIASNSSSASTVDLSPQQVDPAYRQNIAEGWRSNPGTWEDVSGNPQKKDVSQLDSLALHQVRQRQTSATQSMPFSAPSRIDERSPGAPKPGFSPQRFENSLTKDSPAPARYPSTPPKPGGFVAPSQFAGQQALQNARMAYDSLSSSSAAENELALSMRGMVVEDDVNTAQGGPPYRSQGQGQQQSGGVPSHPSLPHIRVPQGMQQPRGPYNAYTQNDYAAYYTGPPTGRDPYVEYPYPYDAYRTTSDPAVYAASSVSAGTSPASLYPSASLPRFQTCFLLTSLCLRRVSTMTTPARVDHLVPNFTILHSPWFTTAPLLTPP
ncbi:hypothetical protein BV25DRAFT_1945439 [Artomyces pyxidatus]|uniref:Uncharacterized protein n=1 Tax=Artomyces pyxidatus TaxID=48021 RepID=A0ACB8T229_9AGAM|nr:hypothetical protein BV25DRAFT_1945439 [Artomyces pyxidatus]